MEVSLVEAFMGVFALDRENRVVDKALFEKSPDAIVERLRRLEAGEAIEELKALVERLRGCRLFIVESEKLASTLKTLTDAEIRLESPSSAGQFLRSNVFRLSVEAGFAESVEEARRIQLQVSTLLTSLRVKEAVGRRDLVAIQMVNAIDELDKTLNLIAGRMEEWYGLHFPEAKDIVSSHGTYARLVRDIGLRESYSEEALRKFGLGGEKARRLLDAASRSVGAPMGAEDLPPLQALCGLYLETSRLRDSLSGRLERMLGDVAPNLKALLGATIGARLLALAGGLSRLSRLPASTIQVLGAEKALFRSLRTGARPPKHGVIFQHHLLQQAPRWQRGKIARALAGKVAIAARVDAFGERDIGEALKADLESRLEEIRKKKPPAPERREKRKPARRGGRRERRWR